MYDRLKGIPLALELAAARALVLAPSQMPAQLPRPHSWDRRAVRATLGSALGSDAFTSAGEVGRAIPREEAAVYALSEKTA